MVKITWKKRLLAMGFGLLSGTVVLLVFKCPTWAAGMMSLIIYEINLIQSRLGMMEPDE